MGLYRGLKTPASEELESVSLFKAAAANGGIDQAFVEDLMRRFDTDEDREAIVALYGRFCLDQERLLKCALIEATTVKIEQNAENREV